MEQKQKQHKNKKMRIFQTELAEQLQIIMAE